MKSSNYQNIVHMESRKRNRNLPVIDEDMLREAVGGQSAEGSMLEIAERIPAGNEEQPELPAVRRRRMTLPDYEATFLKPVRVKVRSALYISEETRCKSGRNRICGKHPPQPSGTLQRGDQPAAQGNKQRRSSVERVIQD